MSTNSNTVISLKSAFLRTQTRILSQPLQAPERWRAGNVDASDIPENAIRDVIREVNRLLRRHTKSAYPSLAIRHVAEQIDALYWAAGAPPLSIEPHDDSSLSFSFHPDQPTTPIPTPLIDPLHPSADLAAPSTIAALPPTWTEADANATEASDKDAAAAARYEQLVARLQELDERRRAARRRLERAREVRERVGAPLRAPRENVQANLVTRDGELSRAVAEAKTLGVRVGARVGAWAEGREGVEGDGGEVVGGRSKEVEREKLRGLLEW
ncbi:hypothetical protein BFW01_g988 [Lasiodiplodia theobromae]|uniref:Kinetochore protein fta4 n=1 Tax=Lasiodiplodia theobromae TaxID=45133 RepID=A0A8H7MCK4_9PEZI|nr:hypothetical protein BFW01_g988 [Lasiodiplodia theobromae]